jgi:hypothetical protein
MALRKPVELPYENDLGHIINVGDKVLIVTTGYSHSVSVRMGTYLGKIRDDKDSDYESGCVVMVDEERRVLRHKETNEELDWEKHIEPATGPRPEYPTLHHVQWLSRVRLTDEQNKENAERQAAHKVATDLYNAKQVEVMKNFHHVYEPYTRRTTLQRNRIYPVNMGLKEFIRQI